MTIGMFAKLRRECGARQCGGLHYDHVYLEVVDLTAFVHAAPEADVCVYDQQNQAHMVRKDALIDLALENGRENFPAGTATGMYDHD